MFFQGVASTASGAAAFAGLPASPAVKSIYLVPSVTGLLFELGVPTSPTGTYLTTQARGAVLGAPNTLYGPFRLPGTPNRTIVSIYSVNGAATCQVFAAPW